ncbi:TPA: hypothetical protein N0F65_012077, partial [Lagenidium giganteum]
ARESTSSPAQNARVRQGQVQTIAVDQTSESLEEAIAQLLMRTRHTIDVKSFGAAIEAIPKITSKRTADHRKTIVLTGDRMRLYGAKFVPDVLENEFLVFTKGAFSEHLEKQVVHSMPGSKRVIEEVDLQTGARRPPVMQVKERLGSINVFLPHCQYDVRVAVSCEFPHQEMTEGLDAMPTAESIRHKDRTSAVGRDLRVDLTEVKEENTNKRIYEVEVELANMVVEDWLKQPDDQGQSWKAAVVSSSFLWKMVKYFMPNAGQAFKKAWDFPGATEVQNAYETRLRVRGKFGGTMPVGFARWHIPHVKKREYYVSEKTDGVRYFLVVAGGTTVLVDRSNSPFTTSGLDLLNLVLPEGTVLDGEFVEHQKEKRFVFMAFDIIATGPSASDSHVDKPFSQRLEVLNDFLSDNGPYAAGLRDHNIHRNAVLTLLRKKWMPLRHISDVFRQIQRVQKRDQSVARIYSDDKRVHFTDGIVFCPNTPYIPNTHKEYLKWKWSDLITVDFLASLNDANEVSLTCGGPRNSHIDLDSVVVLDPKDTPTVQRLLMRSPSRMAVLEFAFNADKGLWNYKCPRPDKDCANYIRTVLGSLVNMAEAISEEELQFRLTNPHGDQWNEHMKKMRRSILERYK